MKPKMDRMNMWGRSERMIKEGRHMENERGSKPEREREKEISMLMCSIYSSLSN